MARARVYEINGGNIVTPEGWQYARNRVQRNEGDGNYAQGPLVDTYSEARRIREDFYGKAIEGQTELSVRWPRFIKYVGVTNAEQYLSDKKLANWKKELFKHLAEDEQYLFINPAITTLLNDRGERVDLREAAGKLRAPEANGAPTAFYAASYEIGGPMAKHIAVLADDKGVQWVTSDGQFWEMRIPDCTLAAAPIVRANGYTPNLQRNPKAKCFLFSYSTEGVHYIITGKKLNVTKDGIVH